MDILSRYEPQALKDVVGNRIQIKRLQQLLQLGQPDAASCYMIGLIGPNGCGKTLISKLLFKEMDFNVLSIQPQDIKDMEDLIKNFCSHKTIESFFKTQRKVIFVDDLDSLITQDKHVLSTLTSCVPLVKKYNSCIFFTCKGDEKKLSDLKKDVETVKINYPSIKDSFIYLSEILIERENSDIKEEDLLKIVNNHRGSVRHVVLSLKDSNETHEETCKNNMYKDNTVFEIVRKLMTNSIKMKDIDLLINDDPFLTSFLFYENLPEEMSGNYSFSKDNKLTDVYLKINRRFIDSCFIEDSIFRNSDWSYYNYIHLLRIMGPVLELNGVEKKKTMKDCTYRFSQILSKISHKNIMSKKLKNDNLEMEERIILADKISTEHDSKMRKTLKIPSDDLNFLNSYDKYFE